MTADAAAREALLERSRGVLPPPSRERLGAMRALVVGAGGVGGVVAQELARSGFGAIVLVDDDSYEPSNANRQICCYGDSLGRPKVEVLAERLRAIPGGPETVALRERGELPRLGREIGRADLVVAAADDYAFSLGLLDAAREAGALGAFALPIGLWAGAALLAPGGPRASRLFGLAPGSVDDYRAAIGAGLGAFAEAARRRAAAPSTPEYGEYRRGELPPPQLCPVVWAAASFLALEAVKALAGIGKPLLAPHWLEIGARGPRRRLSLGAALGLPA